METYDVFNGGNAQFIDADFEEFFASNPFFTPDLTKIPSRNNWGSCGMGYTTHNETPNFNKFAANSPMAVSPGVVTRSLSSLDLAKQDLQSVEYSSEALMLNGNLSKPAFEGLRPTAHFSAPFMPVLPAVSAMYGIYGCTPIPPYEYNSFALCATTNGQLWNSYPINHACASKTKDNIDTQPGLFSDITKKGLGQNFVWAAGYSQPLELSSSKYSNSSAGTNALVTNNSQVQSLSPYCGVQIPVRAEQLEPQWSLNSSSATDIYNDTANGGYLNISSPCHTGQIPAYNISANTQLHVQMQMHNGTSVSGVPTKASSRSGIESTPRRATGCLPNPESNLASTQERNKAAAQRHRRKMKKIIDQQEHTVAVVGASILKHSDDLEELIDEFHRLTNRAFEQMEGPTMPWHAAFRAKFERLITVRRENSVKNRENLQWTRTYKDELRSAANEKGKMWNDLTSLPPSIAKPQVNKPSKKAASLEIHE